MIFIYWHPNCQNKKDSGIFIWLVNKSFMYNATRLSRYLQSEVKNWHFIFLFYFQSSELLPYAIEGFCSIFIFFHFILALSVHLDLFIDIRYPQILIPLSSFQLSTPTHNFPIFLMLVSKLESNC